MVVIRSKIDVVLKKSVLASSIALSAFAFSPAAAVADTCTDLSNPIYQVINPGLQTNLLTPWENEANNAVQYGFTQKNGTPFYAALAPTNGLVGAHWSSPRLTDTFLDYYVI